MPNISPKAVIIVQGIFPLYARYDGQGSLKGITANMICSLEYWNSDQQIMFYKVNEVSFEALQPFIPNTI